MNHRIISELRKSGNLDMALTLAIAEWEKDPKNIWCRRNLAWVYFDIQKLFNNPEKFEVFIKYLDLIRILSLPPEDKIFYESICWQIVKMAFSLSKSGVSTVKANLLYESIKGLYFPKPSLPYSMLFISMHKCLKYTPNYTSFADWWDFKHFRKQDYQKRLSQTTDRELLSIVEQSYMDYARRLLYKSPQQINFIFDKERALRFLPRLIELTTEHPEFKYIPYQIARIYLALGYYEQAIKISVNLLRKNRNNFWGWALLAESYKENMEFAYVLLCRTLSIPYQETAKKKYRLMLADYLINQKRYDEARTEIDIVIRYLQNDGKAISKLLTKHIQSPWYVASRDLSTNASLYKSKIFKADDFLDGNPEKSPIMVEFVNTRRKILYFITEGGITGFFKYERHITKVSVGDKLLVRFRGKAKKGINLALSVEKTDSEQMFSQFLKPINGTLELSTLTGAGWIGDVHVSKSIVLGSHLSPGLQVEGTAIMSYNRRKNAFGWKAISIKKHF